jgi:hypothetical protein
MKMTGVRSAFPLLLASACCAQSWQFTLRATTDTLKRIYQPMRVEIPVTQFDPALPKTPSEFRASIQKDGAAGEKPAQVLWTAANASTVSILWMEENLAPSISHTWRLQVTPPPSGAGPAEFKTVKADSGIDVIHGTRKVYRYQDIHDPAKSGETRRPFNHIYGSDGGYISKGNEGEHPHQRGVMMGWNVNGHGYWTNGGGTLQLHKAYDAALDVSGPVFSRVSSTISWQHNKVEEIVETRTVEAWWVKPGVTLLDFRYVLSEPAGKSFSLEGEGAHAGMQFRAGDEVNLNREDSLLGAKHYSQEGPFRTGANYVGKGHWIAQLFPIRGIKYVGLVMDHLDNPKPTEFPSRDYGRFGVFFNHVQPAGKPLPLYYRFLFADRSVQDTAGLGASWNAFQYPPAVTVAKGVGLSRGAGPLRGGDDARLGIHYSGYALHLLGASPLDVTLHGLDGRLLRSQRLTADAPLSLAGLPGGLVWIRVRGADGVKTRSLLLP